MSGPRLYVVADVAGPDDYHLGDEAMLEANLETLRRLVPDVRFTVPSRDPAWTSRRYDVDGCPAPAVPAALLADDDLAAQSIAAGAAWLGEDTLGRLRACQGLVISGGGNLCSTWPEKLLERVALMAVARASSLPVVVVGQTLGPWLTTAQRALLGTVLPQAGWVGVRERGSARLAAELGVAADRIDVQLDDAFFLASEGPPSDDAGASTLAAHPRRIVVTLDASFGAPLVDDALRSIASQLDGLATFLDATLVFSPHVGGAAVPAEHDDRGVGQKLAALVQRPLVVLDLWQPRAVRGLIESALFVVSARYHPLVFATAAGVPALGIHSDDYTRTKLRGALAPAGREAWSIAVDEAAGGMLLPLAAELWSLRDGIRDRAATLRRDGWEAETRRWQAILRALDLAPGASLAHPPEAVVTGIGAAVVATPTAPVRPLLSEEQWRSYDELGYLRLGRLLDPAAVAALQQRLDDIMLGRVRYPTLQMQRDTGGAYDELPVPVGGEHEATLVYRKVHGLEVDPLVLALLRHPIFREICARQYGPHASVSIFRAMMMNKPAGQGTYLPWHQDGGDVWKLDRDPLVTIWVALDDATRANGCLQVVPGSHRLGVLTKYGSTLGGEHVEAHCAAAAATHLEVAAGEALVLHNWLIHRSGVNPTSNPRRAFTACFMDARTLGTLTGRRYPVVFGAPEPLDIALPFVEALHQDKRRLLAMHREAERYAKSLEHELQKRDAAASAAAETAAAEAADAAEAAAAAAALPPEPPPAASPRRWWRRR